MQGLKKMFNPFEPRNLIEMTKSFLKVGIVGYVGFSTVMGRKDEILGLLGVDIPTAFPEKRPSVMSATSLSRPIPAMAEVGLSISRIPGPPLGPS